MSTGNPETPAAPKTKSDPYQKVTDALLALMEQGVEGWEKPWKGLALNRHPINGVSKRPYAGWMNKILLATQFYPDPRWVTFNQARSLKGSVTKGQKGTPITFWYFQEEEKKNPETGKVTKTRVPYLRIYTVFNVAQCEGLSLEDVPPQRDQVLVEEELQKVITRHNPTITFGGSEAFYQKSTDRVQIPLRESFTSDEAFQATLAHELIHWTASRLGRDLKSRFEGEQAYAMEELIAELGAAFLCTTWGVPVKLQHHAAYLQSWQTMLKGDKYAIFTAVRKAQEAVDFLLGTSSKEEAAEEES